ncbi:hypothetical protein KR054_005219 [Drosophila jambulina]|nr:hypothetical protein KR054_005219 [Drosophila jambulina]
MRNKCKIKSKMAFNEEQEQKMLNAELVGVVQQARINRNLDMKELIVLQQQNLALRASLIRQDARQRQDHIDIIKLLMRRFKIDQQCLAMDQEPKSEVSFVLPRRSSKEMCQEMRQFSAAISSPRTISPAKRGGKIAPELMPNVSTVKEYIPRRQAKCKPAKSLILDKDKPTGEQLSTILE